VAGEDKKFIAEFLRGEVARGQIVVIGGGQFLPE
jgi:hypothetical protein